ncbi:MAG: bifunctional (p)ppGpp synthetase/guanosine-3',5'-bis(diphosphate) 3'-pyrophosphohydrolase [Endozoicomonadaceae bacterium]|nr:bifunctional (p)ppGpp synthetase/guanosine-3',5'-bis(diphosphate) 3'-pyrophosphohydrolase [Endozoicomonadaceae bacterium]
MVTVREKHPKTKNGQIDLSQWLNRIRDDLGVPALPLLKYACDTVQIFHHHNKEYYLKAGIDTVEILKKLRLDQSSFVAALLYQFVQANMIHLTVIRYHFGIEISNLIQGVLDINSNQMLSAYYPVFSDIDSNYKQLEKIRKMLIYMVQDIRVPLIKIAETMCVMRLIKKESQSEKKHIARKALFIYAPLAHRLGIGCIKWEMEDLAFSYLNADAYKHIAHLIKDRRIDRENTLQNRIIYLRQHLQKINIQAQIQGRVKNIYSIWRKMQAKKLKFHELYDIQAIRILVNQVNDCYRVLAVIHNLWTSIDSEFDNYIKHPKTNGYQSLHTAVNVAENNRLEVQIRTHIMHEKSEFGACSHWAYKGTDTNTVLNSYEKKIHSLRQVLDWHQEFGNTEIHALEKWRSDTASDSIYVFTDQGDVMELPKGATPLHFSSTMYGRHHICYGATVNGKSVSLTHRLKTGDQVEALI